VNSSVQSEGLRNRKKQQTRETIATVAAELFNSHGYENVRMRDIAHAANVSDQSTTTSLPKNVWFLISSRNLKPES
jgi:DNA-binding transcriptional regulator YbjK